MPKELSYIMSLDPHSTTLMRYYFHSRRRKMRFREIKNIGQGHTAGSGSVCLNSLKVQERC